MVDWNEQRVQACYISSNAPEELFVKYTERSDACTHMIFAHYTMDGKFKYNRVQLILIFIRKRRTSPPENGHVIFNERGEKILSNMRKLKADTNEKVRLLISFGGYHFFSKTEHALGMMAKLSRKAM